MCAAPTTATDPTLDIETQSQRKTSNAERAHPRKTPALRLRVLASTWLEQDKSPDADADAICDRVLHGAHKVTLEGPSRRKVRGNVTTD
jgi:hypothetical protein